MFLGIKSKREKEAERLQKEREERQQQEEKRRQLQAKFSEAKEQLANSLFGIGYGGCDHEQLCKFDKAFKKRFPKMVHLLNEERISQLTEVQNQFSQERYHYSYDSCCDLRKCIIKDCIGACDKYPELIPYLNR